VEGLSGAQFARSGTVDRLRASGDPRHEDRNSEDPAPVLAAVDPANPWGAILPWPGGDRAPDARPRRIAGAWVVFAEGMPVLYLGPSRRHLLSFPEITCDEAILTQALVALAALPERLRLGSLTIEKIDGGTAAESPLAALMLQQGFVRDYRGLVAERCYASTAKKRD